MQVGGAFVGLGVVLVVAVWLQGGAPIGSADQLWWLAVAAAAYGVAAALLFRDRQPGRLALWLCLGLALGVRAPFVVQPVGQNDDMHRYIWDARLQRAGLNPYLVRPDAPAVAHIHTPATRLMNNQAVPSPYPPGAQAFFRIVTVPAESVVAIKAVLVAAEAVTVVALWIWLVGRGRDPAWTLIYAWHPLAIIETARGGHLDALGVMFLAIAAAAIERRRQMIGALAVAASISVKLLPLVLLPLALRQVRPRHALLAAAGLALLYVPYLDGWRIPPGSLDDVADRFRFNQVGFDLVAPFTGPRGAVVAAVGAGLLTAIAVGWRRRLAPIEPANHQTDLWGWPMAAALFFAPMIYPWYLIWLLPFATTRLALPLLVWTLSVIPVYRVWALNQAGAGWVVPNSWLALEYGAVAATAATLAWQRWRRARSRG